jgi:hypothetical protein
MQKEIWGLGMVSFYKELVRGSFEKDVEILALESLSGKEDKENAILGVLESSDRSLRRNLMKYGRYAINFPEHRETVERSLEMYAQKHKATGKASLVDSVLSNIILVSMLEMLKE